MALSEPVTLKATETGENERLDYAVSAMQGYRVNMEDDNAIVLNLDAATVTSFFGVYDGHGGPAVSKYCAKHLHIELRRHENFRNNLQTAIERTFLRMDEMMKDRKAGRELSSYSGNDDWEAYRKATRLTRFIPLCQKPPYPGPENDGCTACVVLIRGDQIIVGNAGDSRCVLSRNNQAIELSTDFKPSIPDERQRIEAAGHEVILSERGNVYRIDDGIAISRSLGDLRYKNNNDLGPQEQAITAFPEVRTAEITQDDLFLIIACDGIWDCLSSQQAVDFIRIYLSAHAIFLNLDAVTGTSFFGVYDDHEGPAVSKYCARHLHIELLKQEKLHNNLQTAIERTFLRMAEMMKDRGAGMESSGYGADDSWKAYGKAVHPPFLGPATDGCNARMVLIRVNQIIVGNAGDSCGVFSRNNQVLDMSTNFKPNLPFERQRLEAAVYLVTSSERGNVHRIDDGIAISRSLGDQPYKGSNALTPLQQEEMTQDDQFLILACDRIWDCLTNQQAVDFIRMYSSADVGLAFICKALIAHCLAQHRGRDNMTDQVRAHNAVPGPIYQAPAYQDAGPICLLSLERVPLIKMQRYMMHKIFAYYAGWIEAKLTRHQMGLLKEAVFEILHQGPNANFADRIRNTVTMVLDGNNFDVWTQYIFVMAHIRFWFVLNGVSINLRPILGYDKYIHIVPSEGTFHLVLRYGPISIDIVIDARESWLYGVAGAKVIVQFERSGRTPYIQHEYTVTLGGDGEYLDLTEGGVADIPIGPYALIAAVSGQVDADENSDTAEVKKQLGVLILHFMEALKFNRVYQIVSESLWSGEHTTLKQKDPIAALLVKVWGKAAKGVGKYVFDYLCQRCPSPLCLKNLDVEGLSNFEDALDNIFIMPQAFIPKEFRKLQQISPEVANSTWNPVDKGMGDAKVIPLERIYNQIQAQREQSMRDKKFIEDRQKYFGNRLGGVPWPKAVDFVKSEARTGVFSWKSPLPVKGSHISTVAHIVKKFARFFK